MRFPSSARLSAPPGLLLVALLSLGLSAEGGAAVADSPLLRLPAYEVTEHSPVIRGRQDEAFKRALASAFRKVIESALRDMSLEERGRPDFSSWQRSVLSRSQDFIASYQVLSHGVREGYLTLSIRARVQSDKLEQTVEDALAESAPLLVRLMVLIDPFAMMGTSFGEDFDAGHEAANALQIAFLKKGAILVPAPEKPPWGSGEDTLLENRISLATASARKLGADYVVAGRLSRSTDSLLILSTDLVSVTAEKVLSSAWSPVELQANVPPQEHFMVPAEEIAALFLRKLK